MLDDEMEIGCEREGQKCSGHSAGSSIIYMANLDMTSNRWIKKFFFRVSLFKMAKNAAAFPEEHYSIMTIMRLLIRPKISKHFDPPSRVCIVVHHANISRTHLAVSHVVSFASLRVNYTRTLYALCAQVFAFPSYVGWVL